MKPFLQYVAEDLITKRGTDLSRVAVVFPNKRAALFLNEHLARLSGQPVWSPACLTISDLFRQHSERQVADPIKLVCDLHRIFIRQTGVEETLDHFYGWGQLLLADFDDLDKNMADADKVFANVRDLRELDDVSYLSENQKEIIARFFGNFSAEHNTQLKERFLKLWSRMAAIYHALNEHLAAQGLAYEGAVYREVAMQKDIPFQYDHYAFVGFNLIQPVEQCLFSQLKEQGKASFYWDFDHYYMENEAGFFVSQNMAHFSNELDADTPQIYSQFLRPKDISFVSAPTENIQARYVSTWLRQGKRIEDGRRTAIVLCNEGLLQTVIHSLPDEVGKVNVTTGYPLIQTPAASFVTLLLNLQTVGFSVSRDRFRLKQVSAVLRHPYVRYLTEEAPALLKMLTEQKQYYPSRQQLSVDEGTSLLFTPQTGNENLLRWLCAIVEQTARKPTEEEELLRSDFQAKGDALFQESVFRVYTLLNRLRSLVESGDLLVDTITLQRLVCQLMSSANVPFHGEPAEGVQVMGILETRNLDFDHVLMLSCNEGNMPKGISDTSFIPYNVRKAFGLTTVDHKVSIFSYYFHRLLQRAGDVTIVYNNATQDGQTGEMSRFMLQLMSECPHKIHFSTLQASQDITPFRPQTVEKTDAVMGILRKRFSTDMSSANTSLGPLLTPTAINRYLRCPLMFYYTYVCNLRQPDETDDDVIDSRIFGNIFHEAAQTLYERIMTRNHQIMPGDIEDVLKSKADIERAVDEAIQKELFPLSSNLRSQISNLNGLQLINREVIIHYLRQLFRLDSKLAPFTIVGLECDIVAPIQTPFLNTTIGGRIDRLDCITLPDGREQIRVVDYKTGSRRLVALPDIEAVFSPDNIDKHSDYYLQALLYTRLVRHSVEYNPKSLASSPALLFIQHASADDYDPVLYFGKERIDDVDNHTQRFDELLMATISQIFNHEQPFLPTTNRRLCANCPYKLLCHADTYMKCR